VSIPLMLPAAFGENETNTCVVSPGLSDKGIGGVDAKEKAVELRLKPVSVRLRVPALVMVTDCGEVEEPMVTLPKVTDVGLALIILEPQLASAPVAAQPAASMAMRMTANIHTYFQELRESTVQKSF
jgi:hypothetical protein